jgi:hypothetical protein
MTDDSTDCTPPSFLEDHQKKGNMSMFDKVTQFLAQENWKGVLVDHEDKVLHLGAGGSNGSYRVAIHVKEDDNVLLVFVQCPIKVPQDKRLVVAEYLTRANYGVTVGNFELDLGDGEVRVKGSIDYADGDLTAQMVDRLLSRCGSTMDRYFPGLMKIIYGDVDAMEAIREAEPLQARGEALLQALASAIAVQVVDEEEQEGNATSGVTVEVLEDGNEEEAEVVEDPVEASSGVSESDEQ